MKLENKNTKYKSVSISCCCGIEADVFLVIDALRQRSLQSNETELS